MCCQSCAEGRAEHVITDAAGRLWRFETHHFCGPMVLRQDGQPKARQPGCRSAFWPAFDAWNTARKGYPGKVRRLIPAAP
jgi:hypothetical protein